jgi:hypothetical protein
MPLFYDSTAWVLPAGALTHLMITIPFWTSQLWLGDGWLGANGVPLAISALFVLTSGAYLEWLVAVMSKVGFLFCTGRSGFELLMKHCCLAQYC